MVYALVDQHVEQLCNGSRFVLWAMRRWTQAAVDGSTPSEVLALSFAQMGAAEMLPDFHAAMALLNADARTRLEVAPMNHIHITESEAILLTLWSDSLSDDTAPRARATIDLMIEAEAAAPLSHALASAARGLAERDLAPSGLETHFARKAY